MQPAKRAEGLQPGVRAAVLSGSPASTHGGSSITAAGHNPARFDAVLLAIRDGHALTVKIGMVVQTGLTGIYRPARPVNVILL